MKKATKRKIGDITLNLLEQIAIITEGLTYAFIDHKKISRLKKFGGEMESERFFDYLRGLRNSGYVEFKREKNSLSIKLTNKGQIKLIENSKDKQIDDVLRKPVRKEELRYKIIEMIHDFENKNKKES